MKTALTIPLILLVAALNVSTASSTPPNRSAAKECSDCGCGGPEKGMCPKEKGKTCKCPMK